MLPLRAALRLRLRVLFGFLGTRGTLRALLALFITCLFGAL